MNGYAALPTCGKSNYYVPVNNEDILSTQQNSCSWLEILGRYVKYLMCLVLTN
jgi:hypothetical protein